MTAKLKIPLICALIALALSVLLGLVSGVRFSAILMRSLIIFLISGGFVFGVQILLEHFVPDLFQPLSTQGAAKKETGKNVNISIDDPIEMPVINDEEISAAESDAVKADEDSVLDDIQGLGERKPDQEDFDTAKDASAASVGREESSDKTIETVKKQEKNTVKELEELPDLQDFIPEDDSEQGDDQMDFTQRGTSTFDVSTDLAASGMDTNTMVSAIRTVLKRDS
ncbi:hypothetical protein [Treponema putidum]|uniref:Uncharacterized protein n=1 Tax=Treponema putidum TaxID=221027 RepID=A0AAE9SMF5_9SPIR|nr:hypothetical protein [Treponema putidum]UTY34789.1 hypothetical protein E4N74_12850 [Treponema putidum]